MMVETRFGSQPAPLQEVEVQEQQQADERTQFLPLWKVILFNDDFHLFEEVVHALVSSVQGISGGDAWAITLKTHREGRAVVVVCPLEEAELYKERLETFRLTVGIERD